MNTHSHNQFRNQFQSVLKEEMVRLEKLAKMEPVLGIASTAYHYPSAIRSPRRGRIRSGLATFFGFAQRFASFFF